MDRNNTLEHLINTMPHDGSLAFCAYHLIFDADMYEKSSLFKTFCIGYNKSECNGNEKMISYSPISKPELALRVSEIQAQTDKQIAKVLKTSTSESGFFNNVWLNLVCNINSNDEEHKVISMVACANSYQMRQYLSALARESCEIGDDKYASITSCIDHHFDEYGYDPEWLAMTLVEKLSDMYWAREKLNLIEYCLNKAITKTNNKQQFPPALSDIFSDNQRSNKGSDLSDTNRIPAFLRRPAIPDISSDHSDSMNYHVHHLPVFSAPEQHDGKHTNFPVNDDDFDF